MDTFAQNYNAMLAAKREQLLRDRRESADAAGSPSRSPVGESVDVGVRKVAPASVAATCVSRTPEVCNTTNQEKSA